MAILWCHKWLIWPSPPRRKIPPHWSQYPEKHQKYFPLCWSFTSMMHSVAVTVSVNASSVHNVVIRGGWGGEKGILHTVKTTFCYKLLLLTYSPQLWHACSCFLEHVTKPGENRWYLLENSSLLCGKSFITVAKKWGELFSLKDVLKKKN